jgi:hypothetical protein
MMFLILFTFVSLVQAGQPELISVSVGSRSTQAFYGSRKSKYGVIFLHSRGQTYKQWSYLTQYLSKKSQMAISLDLIPLSDLPPENQHLQVLAAAEVLTGAGAKQITCVGIDFSASLCAKAAKENPKISKVALISPDWLNNGLYLNELMVDNVSYYAMASEYDGHAVRTLDELGRRDNLTVIMSDIPSQGPKLLIQHPKLESHLIHWILVEPPPLSEVPSVSVDTVKENIEIETKGELLPW